MRLLRRLPTLLLAGAMACGSSTPASESAADTGSSPDTAQSDTAQPDTAQPDTEQPDTEQTDTAQPDTAQPPVGTAPVLSALSVAPTTGNVGTETQYACKATFADSEGDIATMYGRVLAPDGAPSATTSAVFSASGDPKTGEVSLSVPYTPTVEGAHTLEYWVEDRGGNISNVLTTQLTIAAAFVGQAPVVSELVYSPNSTLLGKSVTVEGSFRVTDADGDLNHWFVRFVRPDGFQESSLQGGFPNSKSDASPTFSRVLVAPSQEGDYRVELWADDAEGQLSQIASGIITVAAEVIEPVPVLSDLTATPVTAKTGIAVTYNGSAKVADGDGDLKSLNVRFKLPDGTFSDTTSKPITGLGNPKLAALQFSLSYTALTAGDHELQAWVDDNAGHESNVLTKVVAVEQTQVFVNTPPVISNLQFTPQTVTLGKGFFFETSFVAEDIDGNLRGYAMDLLRPDGSKLFATSTGLVPSGNLTNPTVTLKRYVEPDVPGVYTVQLVVNDLELANSNTLTGALTVEAVPDSPPVATVLELAPSSAKTGIKVSYHGRVGFTDINGDTKELRVLIRRPDNSATADTVFPVTGIPNPTAGYILYDVEYTADTAGTYALEARVVDKAAHVSNVVTGAITITAPPVPVSNAPTATDLVVAPELVTAGRSVTLTGSFSAADEDGDLSVRYLQIDFPNGSQSAVVSAVISGPTGQKLATVPFTYTFTPPVVGDYVVNVWVKDTAGALSNVSTALVTAEDPPVTSPVAAGLVLDAFTLNTGVAGTVTGSLTGTDPQGDINGLQLRIRRPDGVLSAPVTVVVSGVGVQLFSLPYTAPSAGNYSLEAWFTDAEGNTSNTESASFVVVSVTKPQNSVPLASGLVFAPTSAIKGLPVVFAGTLDATDVDADLASLQLRFKKPGGIGLTEVSAPLGLSDLSGGQVAFTLSLTPDVVGTWTLEAYVKDSKGAKSTTLSGTFTVANPPSTVPVASSVSVDPAAVDAGAAISYSGTVSFTDTDDDASLLHLRFKRPGGTVSAETVVPVVALADAGDGSGPVAYMAPFTITYTATVAGDYTLEVWVTDAAGQKSNTVTAPITAAAVAQPTNAIPVLEALSLTANSGTLGQATTVAGKVLATDTNQNWSTVHTRLRRPNGTTLSESSSTVTGLSGKSSGEIALTRTFTPDSAGTWLLEVWVKDAAGAVSPTVSAEVLIQSPAAPSDTAPVLVRLAAQPLSLLIDKTKTITGTVEVTDLDADHEVVLLRLIDPMGSIVTETYVPMADFEGTAEAMASFTFDTTLTVVGDHRLEAQAIDLDGQSSNVASLTVKGYDLSNVNSACAATEKDCTGDGFCYDVTSTTCAYLAEKQVTLAECAQVGSTGSVPACVSSIADTSSPYAFTEANCGFVQYWSNPTLFPIDCRCGDAAFEAPCKRPYELPSTISFGEGPRPRNLATEMRLWNGPIVGREWFVPAYWKTASKPNQTMIYAINLDTGDRRYFSGNYNDPANGLTRVGSGPDFVQVMDMDLGPDGQFYAVGASSEIAHPKIWRVDPGTGDRTLIFDAATAPASALCPNGSSLPGLKTVQMAAQGWAMDGQGRFYFSMVNQPGPSIVRIAADGQSCDYLTSVVDVPSNTRSNVGGGYDDFQFDFRAFHVKGDKLYAVSNNLFVEVDINTGSRKLLSKATDVGNIGAGPINAEGLGDKWTRWDPYRNIFWTVGALGGSSAIAVDPITGNRFTWPCWHPTLGGPLTACGGTGKALIPGYLNFGGFAIDPEGDHALYFAHDLFSIVKYDPKTGNAYTFSL